MKVRHVKVYKCGMYTYTCGWSNYLIICYLFNVVKAPVTSDVSMQDV